MKKEEKLKFANKELFELGNIDVINVLRIKKLQKNG